MVAKNELATRLTADTTQYVNGMKIARKGTADFSREQKFLAESFGRMEKSSSRASNGMRVVGRSMGRTQQAAQNMVFAVEDAASVYGTSGFSGALRAAGNNLTMVAMAMGGLTAQLTVTAAIVGIQLWQAFSKTNKEMEKTVTLSDKLRNNLNDLRQQRNDKKNFANELAGLDTSKNAANAADQRRQELRKLAEEREDLMSRQASLVARMNQAEAKTKFNPLGGGDPVARRLGFDLDNAMNRGRQLFGADNPYSDMAEAQKQLAVLGEQIRKNSAEQVKQEMEIVKLSEKRTKLKREEQELARWNKRVADDQAAAEERREKRMEAHHQRMQRITNLKNRISGRQDALGRLQDIINDKVADLRNRRQNDPALAGPSAVVRGSQEDLNQGRLALIKSIVGSTQQRTSPEVKQLEKLHALGKQELNVMKQVLGKLERQAQFQAPVGAFRD